MNPVSFSVLTTLGVSVWVSVLTIIGYNAAVAYQSTVKGFGYAGYLVVLAVVAVLAVFYVHRYKAVKGQNAKHARKN